MQSALKAMAAIQAVYHPTEQSLKKNLTSQVSFFQKSTILSSVQDDEFAFAMIDTNRDGLMTAQELHSFLAAFGEDVPFAQVQMAIQFADRNGDGALNFQEFHAANNQNVLLNKPVQLWSAEDEHMFQLGDSNHDGYLDLHEYLELLFSQEPSFRGLVDENWIYAQTSHCDHDHDRRFTRDELDHCN